MNFLEQSNLHKDLLISDFRDLGQKILSNCFANLGAYRRSKRGRELFGKFQNIPAIVCGAGPTLDENMPILKELKDKALIFAGGSAMKILQTNGAHFHFGASFDPDPPEDRFVELNIPFFYQSRVSKDLLKQMKGPLLWIEGNGNYPVEQVLYGDAATFDSGWTVANFITALAYFLGCHPIISVGMDFGAVDGKLYANGVDEKPTVKKDWLLAKEWMRSFSVTKDLSLEKTYDLQGMIDYALSQIGLINTQTNEEEIHKSFKRAKELCVKLLSLKDSTAEFVLTDFELEEEIACKTFLNPLWNVWKEHFPDGTLQKILFYMRAMNDE